MFSKGRELLMVGLVVCLSFLFLFPAVNYAGSVSVLEPGTGDVLRSGSIFRVQLSVPWDPNVFPVTQYKLFYACKGVDFGSPPVFKLITTRYCSPIGGCPLMYPWEVPGVGPIEVMGDGKGNENGICDPDPVTNPDEVCSLRRACAIKAVARDAAGNVLGSGVSQLFTIAPQSPYMPPYLDTVYQSVGPGQAAAFKLNGGRAPYTVSTDNPGITTINGLPSPQTLPGPTPIIFTVENSLAAPCTDTSVTVEVSDNLGTKITATYFINCP